MNKWKICLVIELITFADIYCTNKNVNYDDNGDEDDTKG